MRPRTPRRYTGDSMASQPRTHHRPVLSPSEKFDRIAHGENPAIRHEAAYASARVLLARGRNNTDPQVAARLVNFTDEYGIETLALMWSSAPALSLPGALWRMYSLRDTVHRRPEAIAQAFGRGISADYRSYLLAGVPDPPGIREVSTTADRILAGVYEGDFDIALDRFAAFIRVVALGLSIEYRSGDIARAAGVYVPVAPSHEVRREGVERMLSIPRRVNEMNQIAADLEEVAALWRHNGELEAF